MEKMEAGYFTKTRFTVRYADTDQMGIAHHSNYAVWYEAGRTDYIKSLGLSYSGIEQQGILLPLTDLFCSFKRPAFYEDALTVVTRLQSIGYARAVFAYEVYNEQGELLSGGRTHHAWTNKVLQPVNIAKIMPEMFAMLKKLACDSHEYKNI